MDAVRKIADAVLYEGYILWPYRASALKNQKRWTFGGVYPPAHSERHPDDRALVRAEVLLDGNGKGEVEVTARFLQVVRREVSGDGPLEDWDEAVEREIGPGEFCFAAGEEVETLAGGTITRSWQTVEGRLDVRREGSKVTAELVNTSPWTGDDREQALRHAMCSAHVILRVSGGVFASQQDVPDALSEQTAALSNEGLWPVMVGPEGSRDVVMASPFILQDHPQIAPESPGDFFDGGEIDQMLVLNILTLTDAEKEEMRRADPRAREILERTEAMSDEEKMALHGAVREFGMAR